MVEKKQRKYQNQKVFSQENHIKQTVRLTIIQLENGVKSSSDGMDELDQEIA